MNKFKVYTEQQPSMEKNINSSNYHEYNADLINKNITNTIKKFSSERSLFFSNLNDAINDCNTKWMGDQQAIRFKDESTTMSRPKKEPTMATAVTAAAALASELKEETVRLRRHDPTNFSYKMANARMSMVAGGGGLAESSGGGGGGGNRWKALLRRCKSSKNLFQTGFMGKDSAEKAARKEEEKLASFRKTDNLDEFDKYYLFSGNRKNIVKELRKNFETPAAGNGAGGESPSNLTEVNNDKTVKVSNGGAAVDAEAPVTLSQPPQPPPQNITRKARRFFEIFSSGKNQNLKSQKPLAGGEVLKKTNNKEKNKSTEGKSSAMCEIATQTVEDLSELMEPFYLHDKYGMKSRQNLNSVFYGGNTSNAGTSTEPAVESQDSLDEIQEAAQGAKVSPANSTTSSTVLRSKVMEKYGDRMRESESFSKFLSHTGSPASTPKLKAVTKIDPDLLHKPRNNTLNLYGPRRNSTSNIDDLQRCDMIIENDFESMPPPLNPSFQQQYLEATNKKLSTQTGLTAKNLTPPEKNLKNYSEKLLANSDHLTPKVNNIEEDLYMLSQQHHTKGRTRFTHIKSDSANNVSDFDVELRGEDDFVDPKWCSYTSINSGFGHASFYRQFGKMRKVIVITKQSNIPRGGGGAVGGRRCGNGSATSCTRCAISWSLERISWGITRGSGWGE